MDKQDHQIIEIRPEFNEALQNCIHFSSKYLSVHVFVEEKGKAANMLKPGSKRKRGAVEVLMADEERKEEELSSQEYQGEIRRLRTELEKANEAVLSLSSDHDVLVNLYSQGVIDLNG